MPKKRVELELIDPLYSTYHHQGTCTAILVNNPSIRNWTLNETMNLTCTRKFLTGFTTPEITVFESSWEDCPHFQRISISSRFIGGHINRIIRNMLDDGYYVAYSNVDDYYVQGKSWYKKRHFNHDGMICGYDQNDNTYCLYAYDSNWVYRKFWTPKSSFDKGRIAMEKQGAFSNFYALKPRSRIIDFSPKTVYANLKEYLDSDLKKYPFKGEGPVLVIAVHAYIAEYILMLYRGEIPYELMDTRVFRIIWEHKKTMLERLKLVEKSLGLSNTVSSKYENIVKEADTMRMLYASHHMKRRDTVLPVIHKKLLKLMKDEKNQLKRILSKMEEVL